MKRGARVTRAGSDHPFRGAGDTVGNWGEVRLIAALRRWLGQAAPAAPAGIGDDCAVLPGPAPQLVTVDPIVFGRHFDESLPPELAGAKLLKRNLSDIAAMGGRPAAAVVGLLLSSDLRADWLRRFHKGLGAAALRYGVRIVGGDIAQIPARSAREPARTGFSAHLTLLGWLPGGRALLRTGARAGDLVYVTGELGRSLSTGHHFRFEPRLREGEWLAGRAEVTAMIDVSDGIGKDLRSLTPKGATPIIWPDLLPRRQGASLTETLSDGEDYELLFSIAASCDSARLERDFRRKFPEVRLTRIGHFSRGRPLPAGAIPSRLLRGYEHLR